MVLTIIISPCIIPQNTVFFFHISELATVSHWPWSQHTLELSSTWAVIIYIISHPLKPFLSRHGSALHMMVLMGWAADDWSHRCMNNIVRLVMSLICSLAWRVRLRLKYSCHIVKWIQLAPLLPCYFCPPWWHALLWYGSDGGLQTDSGVKLCRWWICPCWLAAALGYVSPTHRLILTSFGSKQLVLCCLSLWVLHYFCHFWLCFLIYIYAMEITEVHGHKSPAQIVYVLVRNVLRSLFQICYWLLMCVCRRGSTDTTHEVCRHAWLCCQTGIFTVDLIPTSERFVPCSLVFFLSHTAWEKWVSGRRWGQGFRMPLDLYITEEKCCGSNCPNSRERVLSHDALEKYENMLTEEQQEQKSLRDAVLLIAVVLACCRSDPGEAFSVWTELLRVPSNSSTWTACVRVINIDLCVRTSRDLGKILGDQEVCPEFS